MRPILRFLVPALLFLVQPAVAQQTTDGYCGTHGITKWFEWYCQNRNVLAADRGNDTAWLYVPITLQITGTDAGADHFNLELGFGVINNMNKQFSPAKIRFYLMPGDPFRYLNNSYWHDHQWDGGADLITSNLLPDRLNAFVVKNPAGNCGYSWMDAIVLSEGSPSCSRGRCSSGSSRTS